MVSKAQRTTFTAFTSSYDVKGLCNGRLNTFMDRHGLNPGVFCLGDLRRRIEIVMHSHPLHHPPLHKKKNWKM